jgi:carbon-monoxide dehydrogenase medium subunit
MNRFEYRRPDSAQQAIAQLRANPEAKPIAGGQSLLPAMKLGLAAPAALIDLARVRELRGITAQADGLRIGAMTTHAEVAAAPEVRRSLPALARLADGIGDPAVRNRGTLGGSLANNDPAADYPAAVLALAATIETDRRTIAADDFFRGLYETALEPDELIVAVRFPPADKAGWAKFEQPASRFALVGVFVARRGDAVRVAVTGAAACVFRAPALEAALAREWSPRACDSVTIAADGLNGDLHASAEYRAHLVRVLAKRAVESAG